MTDTREPHSIPLTTSLHGHGLTLRTWDPESATDVAAWLRAHTDPDFLRWNTPLRTIEDTASARASLDARAADVATGRAMTFCVTDAGDGTILGQVSVNAIDRIFSCGVVGYWVLPEAVAGTSPPAPCCSRHVGRSPKSACTGWSWATASAMRRPAGSPSGAVSGTRGPCAARCGRRTAGTPSGTPTATADWPRTRSRRRRDGGLGPAPS